MPSAWSRFEQWLGLLIKKSENWNLLPAPIAFKRWMLKLINILLAAVCHLSHPILLLCPPPPPICPLQNAWSIISLPFPIIFIITINQPIQIKKIVLLFPFPPLRLIRSTQSNWKAFLDLPTPTPALVNPLLSLPSFQTIVLLAASPVPPKGRRQMSWVNENGWVNGNVRGCYDGPRKWRKSAKCKRFKRFWCLYPPADFFFLKNENFREKRLKNVYEDHFLCT